MSLTTLISLSLRNEAVPQLFKKYGCRGAAVVHLDQTFGDAEILEKVG